MRVSALYYYPIKGMGGIEVPSMEITPKGPANDRRYMLVNEHGEFISQRQFSELALFTLHKTSAGFEVVYKQQGITIPYSLHEGERHEVKIWDDKVRCISAEPSINDWFSDQLKHKVRLMFMTDEAVRNVDTKYAHNFEQVSLADGYPILIISEASLHLLNQKLKYPIGMDRFRPNMVISNAAPHEEDELRLFEVNGVKLKGVKPCARCTVTTINQLTGVKGKEPLATLSTYRNVNQKILFGMNVVVETTGKICVGDQLIKK
ncbi:MAG: MOSC domain-containing protein [Bacteroidia bacterium]|jgi:hypothetical protein|nr:MOSC domain-containing protein [Bacteroidia bacterium]